MKLVALDVGEKRIGVATADSSVKIAVPHGTVMVDGNELAKIAEIMKLEDTKHLIVGLPRNAQGEETAQSRAVRDFVKKLQTYFVEQKLEKPLVKFQDESLTSVVAENRLTSKKTKKRHKGPDIDSEAAAIILQDFLVNFGKESTFVDDVKKKTKMKSGMKHKALKILMTLIGLILVAVVGAITWYAEMTKPVVSEIDCRGINPEYAERCVSLTFVVTEGESTNEIIDRLESTELIRSGFAFKIYMRLNHPGVVLRIGSYSLTNYMSIADILSELQKGSSAETFRIMFVPGETIADAKRRLAAAGFNDEEIKAGFAVDYSDHQLIADKPAGASLEGYIYGETYEFFATATVEDILRRTFDEMYSVVHENSLVTQYAERGLSLHDGITLASIIQREAPMNRPEDVRQVAQVFLLRLERNIALGSCAINEYQADLRGLPRNSALHEDVNVLGCPWSSRHCPGLPPTPISSPGKAALLAVANPKEGNYLFFITGDDGRMHYARTEREHQRNIDTYCKDRCFY
jgi:UPF0755 protein